MIFHSLDDIERVHTHVQVPLIGGKTLHQVTYTLKEDKMTHKHLEDLILVNNNEQRAVYLLAMGLGKEFRPMYENYMTNYARNLHNKIPDNEAKYLAFKQVEKDYTSGDKSDS